MTHYLLSFSNANEIRMGSPLKVADVELRGPFIPDMKGYSFQDVGLVSQDGLHCFLIQWTPGKNEPRFQVWHLDGKKKMLTVSPIFTGGCYGIKEINDGIELNIEEWNSEERKVYSRVEQIKVIWE
ncbi:hypothetical protein ACES2I_07315 [Bdellovibrio bacteriovorus]|uniref:hypothetical protein n=1 Tax=Bdellovibrio bacteriovorus TaxID=959 RepID=UPI0035A69CCB